MVRYLIQGNQRNHPPISATTFAKISSSHTHSLLIYHFLYWRLGLWCNRVSSSIRPKVLFCFELLRFPFSSCSRTDDHHCYFNSL
ncbi:unnamed protein product, partial [Vitis vinifera]|uniref:Uncharacterized protein n=1 Tax=Vitis vinifera TaxID=29760 RepID=D7TIV3_VITVI